MKNSLILTLTTLFPLSACGGSDSRDENTNGGASPPADMDITTGNAMLVAKVSYESALAAGSLGDLSTDTGLIASGPNGVSKIDGSFGTSSETGGSTMQVPIPAQTEFCIPSGTVTVSGDIADPFTPTLTKNDFFDVVFDMCNDGFSTTDGDLHFVVDAFTGDFLGGVYDLTMIATLTAFQVATDADVLTSNGDATVRLNTLLTPAISVDVSGSSITIDKNSSSETQTNFSSMLTANTGVIPSPYTMVSSGTPNSTQLSGIVTYSTPVMFEGFDADYPHSGEFLVSGASSSVRLVAVDNVNVRIEIDTNDDGTIEETINTTWAELTASP